MGSRGGRAGLRGRWPEMERRTLGRTDMEVSRLGCGLAAIAQETLDDLRAVERTLLTALERGINFFDTAECYLDSEEMVGRVISRRRPEFFLATKCGHSPDGERDEWTAQGIAASIDRSLRRLRTDYVDLLQLHSCDLATLKRGEAIEALVRARQAGKTRFIGYSGDNEMAQWAVESGVFDTCQVSFSLVDQRPRFDLLQLARERGVGVIVKRPIANGAWGSPTSPTAHLRWGSDYGDEYWRRSQSMASLGPLRAAPEDAVTLALGFVFAHPQVDTAILGTRNPDHMRSNIELVEGGLSLDSSVVYELYRRWDELDDGWLGQK